jgi:hypothetical protein
MSSAVVVMLPPPAQSAVALSSVSKQDPLHSPIGAIQKPSRMDNWRALREEVKKRRKALVGGFTYSGAFLEGGCF